MCSLRKPTKRGVSIARIGLNLIIWSLVFFIYVGLSKTVLAAENFSTKSSIEYDISTTGQTEVTHFFEITNLTPTTYLSQHTLKLSYPDISNIQATSQGARIEPYVVKEGAATSITLNFDDSIVGEGQTRKFSLSYTTSDIAEISGEVLEVRIPMLAGADGFASHNVTVTVPAKFGQPVRTNPQPSSINNSSTQSLFTFDSKNNQSITMQFGSEQFYRITTSYPLRNDASSPAFGQITLPSDTSYQRFEYRTLDPHPEAIKTDTDGNWIATYIVPPNEELIVRLVADVRLSLEPDPNVPIPQPVAGYTASQPFWQTTDPQVAKLFGQDAVDAVYQTVIKTLTYDEERVKKGELTERLGAIGAIENPTAAVCQEYADLVVTGWRRAGVPARRLNGFAYTTNQSTRPLSYAGTVLHAWAEYFDQAAGLWKMTDPTWEDTTGGVDYFHQFDLNHIVFSTYGVSSSEPLPAGSYANDQNQTDLTVELTAPYSAAQPEFSISLVPENLGIIKLPGQYRLVITNLTGRAWYTIHTTLSADTITLNPASTTHTLLPFESKQIAVRAYTPIQDGIISREATIQLQLPTGTITQHVNITAAPQIVEHITSINVTTPVGGIALILTLGAGSILVFRRKRKTPLRRQSKKSQEKSHELSATEPIDQSNSPDGTGSSQR